MNNLIGRAIGRGRVSSRAIWGVGPARLALVGVPLALLIGACAPAAGRATVTYTATPSEVIAVIARQGPSITPPNGYNYFSIETISEGSVTLRSDPVTGLSVIGFVAGIPTEPARITVSTFADGSETVVVISVFPGRLTEVYDSVVELLNRNLGRSRTLTLPGGGAVTPP